MDETGESAKVQAILDDYLFVWDDDSKLYFHASTGFYHNPNSGWYYSSRDGLYYKFEDGNYIPLTCDTDENFAAHKCTNCISSEPAQVVSCFQQHSPIDGTASEPPPSQWIEDTLIELYLSGYNNAMVNPESLPVSPTSEQGFQVQCKELTDHLASDKLPACLNGTENQQSEEWAPNPEQEMDVLTGIICSEEEEKWQAQYGQVIQVANVESPLSSVVDLWDWEVFMETIKKNLVARLKGRLSKRLSKLHPSVPASGILLKTAAIHDVHLNLVRVRTGTVYRLRSPSMNYLASISTYDSSNPTKDWDFPDIFASNHECNPVSHNHDCNLEGVDHASSSITVNELSCTGKKSQKNSSTYRDRAAERRALHGGFGTGPGEKSVLDDKRPSEAPETSEPDVLYEATNASFGPGSYARRVLKSMGWKHGESLGRSNRGILEPLRPVGNKGYAGLGWNAAHGQT